ISDRAALSGTYRSRSATSRIRSRVGSRTGPLRLKTRETVATETPASRATSRIVILMAAPGAGVGPAAVFAAGADVNVFGRRLLPPRRAVKTLSPLLLRTRRTRPARRRWRRRKPRRRVEPRPRSRHAPAAARGALLAGPRRVPPGPAAGWPEPGPGAWAVAVPARS